jgi:outer membrane scaffolding protein for murein synthesis (MipA/OmpV family)
MNLLTILFLMISFPTLSAEEGQKLPLWEFGVGALPFRADHYRGSPQSKLFNFPLAAYVYRGKNVEAENGYIRGHLVRFNDVVIDLSFSLGLPVNSDTDNLRSGMRDLDPTFELGPMIRYYLWKSKDGQHFVNLEMPYRAVYATNLQYIDHVGYYSIPYVNYLSRPSPETFGWSVDLSLGIQYGSSSFHNRFYAVDTQDVKPGRGYYHSASGYSGTQLALLFSKRIKDVLVTPFFRWDYLDGAVYNKSPLYKNPNYTMYGLAFIWYFARSKEEQTARTMVK